jgi:hypothetical protein
MEKLSLFSKVFASVAIVSALFIAGCTNDPFLPTEQESDAVLKSAHTTPVVNGTTIQNLNLVLEEGAEFTGRITNLTLTRVGDEILASGRLIGSLTQDGVTQRINQVFDGISLNLLDGLLDLIDIGAGTASCQILYLELAPIFLDVLGLVVELPNPLIVEIRAEPGPSQLLGNLLCGLLGILD